MYTKFILVLLASLFVTTTAVLAEGGAASTNGNSVGVADPVIKEKSGNGWGVADPVVKEKKRTADEISQDMFGKGGLFGACQAEMAANCKDEMKLQLKNKKNADRVLEKLNSKNDVYACLKSHEADLGTKCKNHLNNSPQSHRIALRSACMGVIETTCKDTLAMKKDNTPEAITGNNGSKAGKYIQCLMANKDGITDTACSGALAAYMAWFNTPKGQNVPGTQVNTGIRAE